MSFFCRGSALQLSNGQETRLLEVLESGEVEELWRACSVLDAEAVWNQDLVARGCAEARRQTVRQGCPYEPIERRSKEINSMITAWTGYFFLLFGICLKDLASFELEIGLHANSHPYGLGSNFQVRNPESGTSSVETVDDLIFSTRFMGWGTPIGVSASNFKSCSIRFQRFPTGYSSCYMDLSSTTLCKHLPRNAPQALRNLPEAYLF